MHIKQKESIARSRLDIAEEEHTEVIHSRQMGVGWDKEFTLAREGESAKYIFIFHEIVPKISRITVRLRARNTQVKIVSLFLGTQEMRSDISFMLSHEAPDTYGRVIFKAALRDSARVDFKGMIAIAKGADGSDSYLNARALMLSEKAMARIDPQLEILAHNIKASHGATVGRVSAQDLFYLQSRGLSKKSAERIILEGYFADVFLAMPPDLAKKLKASL